MNLSAGTTPTTVLVVVADRDSGTFTALLPLIGRVSAADADGWKLSPLDVTTPGAGEESGTVTNALVAGPQPVATPRSRTAPTAPTLDSNTLGRRRNEHSPERQRDELRWRDMLRILIA